MTATLSAPTLRRKPMELTEQTPQGADKVKRYNWIIKDTPGRLMMLDKNAINVHPSYQRDLTPGKIKEITAEWKWVSFGALVIGERDGVYWAIDGQHRLLAAQRRSDITLLPCVVFKTEGIREEARAFIEINSNRKPVSAIAKHRAKTVAGDEIALFVSQELDALGLKISKTCKTTGQINSIAWCCKRAKDDREAFSKVLSLTAALCQKDKMPVPERLLEALWVINARCGVGLSDPRLAKRLHEKGAFLLINGINRAASLYAKGGGRIWAEGLLEELNKGLRYRFSIS